MWSLCAALRSEEFQKKLLSFPSYLSSAKSALEEGRRLPQTQTAGKRSRLLYLCLFSPGEVVWCARSVPDHLMLCASASSVQDLAICPARVSIASLLEIL